MSMCVNLPTGNRSLIRTAILKQLGQRGMTRPELVQQAKTFCSTISESAV